MGFHEHFHRRHVARAAEPVQTLVSVVYVTAAPTFDGPIGGYTTPGVTAADPTTSAAPKATTPAVVAQSKSSSQTSVAPAVAKSSVTSAANDDDDNATSTASSILKSKSSNIPSSIIAQTDSDISSSTGMPSVISSPTATFATSAPILAATTAMSVKGSATSSTTVSASTASSTSSASSGGMSAGGKAGLAIGILLLVGAILSIALFCFKKRKNAHKELADNEKQDPFADGLARQVSTHTTRTNPNAPRLSLRPVTQFLPNLGERRQSRGNALMTAAAVPMSEKERPMTPQNDNRNNPFGNHAETIDSANAEGPSEVRMMSPTGEVVSAATGAAAGGAAVGLARKASKLENRPQQLDFTKANPFMGPPSPSGTDFSVNSDSTASPQQTTTGAAIAAAGGPANSTVHRVQLDFKPSMEDELELRAGQLIRLLHEYDDGWALCIRLDRTQQGVVPRTCLSTRPVKPRPQGPPGPGSRGPPPGMRVQGRPMTPTGPQGRPMTPNGQPGRPMPPNGQPGRPMTPNSQQARPMSPGMANGPPRSRSPGPNSPNRPNQQQRARSPSAAQTQARRNSPPGPSPMNPSPPTRKPVPGQAL